MKLSEAIRLGAMLKPQGYDDYERDGATCAIGAAMDCCGILGTYQNDEMLVKRWPILYEEVASPIAGINDGWTVFEIILDLNDDEKWSRERIADWVATIEARYDDAEANIRKETVESATSIPASDPVAGTISE